MMLNNSDFAGKWDYVPYEEYSSHDNRRFCNPFSARKVWTDAVCFYHSAGYELC
jgi:hypothetical protein